MGRAAFALRNFSANIFLPHRTYTTKPVTTKIQCWKILNNIVKSIWIPFCVKPSKTVLLCQGLGPYCVTYSPYSINGKFHYCDGPVICWPVMYQRPVMFQPFWEFRWLIIWIYAADWLTQCHVLVLACHWMPLVAPKVAHKWFLTVNIFPFLYLSKLNARTL